MRDHKFYACKPFSFLHSHFLPQMSDRCGPAGITRFIATRPGQWNRWMVVVGLVLDVYAFNGSDFTAWCDLPQALPPCDDVVFLGPGVTEGRALLYNSRSSLCTGENTNYVTVSLFQHGGTDIVVRGVLLQGHCLHRSWDQSLSFWRMNKVQGWRTAAGMCQT